MSHATCIQSSFPRCVFLPTESGCNADHICTGCKKQFHFPTSISRTSRDVEHSLRSEFSFSCMVHATEKRDNSPRSDPPLSTTDRGGRTRPPRKTTPGCSRGRGARSLSASSNSKTMGAGAVPPRPSGTRPLRRSLCSVGQRATTTKSCPPQPVPPSYLRIRGVHVERATQKHIDILARYSAKIPPD